jgi:antitoxin component YwqK of YwqJK toxin-antitoxin module
MKNSNYFQETGKFLFELHQEILNKIINTLNYEDSYILNYLNKDFNRKYTKKYLKSISSYIYPHGHFLTYFDKECTKIWTSTNYRNGVKHGLYKQYYKDKGNALKLKVTVNYNEDDMEGEFYYYSNNGNIKAILNYKDNKLNGISKYFQDKILWRTKDWTDGIIINETVYYKTGIIETIITYKNGETFSIQDNYNCGNIESVTYLKDKNRICRKKFYLNGNLMWIENLNNNKYEGEHKIFYENGNIQVFETFIDDKIEGTSITYLDDGNVESIVNFKNAKIHGKFTRFFNGKEYSMYFENGIKV